MIETPSLVDQYCHGVLRTELGLGTFEAQLARTEGPPAPGTTLFDTQTGFAVRRWCPPLLGLEPHCPPARYLARRRELGVMEADRRLLRGSGITTYLVDAGLPGDLTGPEELASAAAADAHEIVRLELLAEQVADTSGTVESFLANLAEAVHGAAAHAVAFTSVAGVRHGLALAPEPPGPGEVRGAAARWLTGREVGGELSDPVLLRHLLWIAVASGRPLQLHAGLGEPGLRIDRTDPVLLTDFVRATAGLGTDLVLLHGYPYHRHAAHLAGVFPHVYADSGAALVRTGARAATVLAEILELAPFGKILFSSGAQGLPELHVVAARLFREALGRVLGTWVAEGAWSLGDAQRVAGMIAAGNAGRVYGLEEQVPARPAGNVSPLRPG
ncbi:MULTISPECIES: amidohydrolase family protein [Streptomyces]|uniref:Amidohydrolase family protein n=2 Tax=Streptomyces TaxID=1883 RepID=A0AAX3ZF01_STRRO|nr:MULTISPECIES: amidohydrolase family protein [Streptomyces]WDI17802.1 amidohydrolase family protein [Streptomyces enissocaesilis]MBJ6619083.1 amidohydrolase family protein [Streptomyces sp. DHE17-7]MBQ0881081.1 amidohydrolase family protein [Streptomyces sp. RT42]MBQ0915749.1 amidohydrolase family protein [Streptomyces sp. RM99]MBU8549073.1 amidohydrolase family protein [Streptomyces sp. Osf17]